MLGGTGASAPECVFVTFHRRTEIAVHGYAARYVHDKLFNFLWVLACVASMKRLFLFSSQLIGRVRLVRTGAATRIDCWTFGEYSEHRQSDVRARTFNMPVYSVCGMTTFVFGQSIRSSSTRLDRVIELNCLAFSSGRSRLTCDRPNQYSSIYRNRTFRHLYIHLYLYAYTFSVTEITERSINAEGELDAAASVRVFVTAWGLITSPSTSPSE